MKVSVEYIAYLFRKQRNCSVAVFSTSNHIHIHVKRGATGYQQHLWPYWGQHSNGHHGHFLKSSAGDLFEDSNLSTYFYPFLDECFLWTNFDRWFCIKTKNIQKLWHSHRQCTKYNPMYNNMQNCLQITGGRETAWIHYALFQPLLLGTSFLHRLTISRYKSVVVECQTNRTE